MKCLRETAEGTAHDELADYIENGAVESKNDKISFDDTEPDSEIKRGTGRGNIKHEMFTCMGTKKEGGGG